MKRRFYYVMIFSLIILLTNVIFAEFMLPGGEVSWPLYWADISSNWYEDEFKLDPSHEDLIDFSEPSYVSFDWEPEFSYYMESNESTPGTLLYYYEEGEKN